MKIETYIFLEKDNLEEFFKWWRAQQYIDKNSFPDDLPAGNWDEQYELWKAHSDK